VRKLIVPAVALAALATTAACNVILNENGDDNPAAPTPIVSPTATPAPSPTSSPAPSSCPAVFGTTLGSTGGTAPDGTAIEGGVRTARVGSVLRLDITPRGADGQPVPSTCHDVAPSITNSNPTVCELGGSWSPTGGAFTPTLKLRAVGTCTISATSNGRGEAKDFTAIP
jgi:hypothetical protein